MKEILGNNLKQFFDIEVSGKCTYYGYRYEVWEVSDEVFDAMCDMTEERFEELAGKNAWWRSAEGSNLGYPDTNVYINGYELLGWSGRYYGDIDEDDEFEICTRSLSDYFSDVIGASQPRNVCALAVDLAKYNNMTMGELFSKCEAN